MQSDSRFIAILTVRVKQEHIPEYLNLMEAHVKHTLETEPLTAGYECYDGGDGLFYLTESYSSTEGYIAHIENRDLEKNKKFAEISEVEGIQILGNPEGKAEEILNNSPWGAVTINRRTSGYTR